MKHVLVENEINDLPEKLKVLSTKGYNFLSSKTHFTGDDDYQNFSVFVRMSNSLILDNSKKVTNWISTRVSPEKIKPLILTLHWLRLIYSISLKFNKSVLLQKKFFLLYSNFILILEIVHKLNNRSLNASINFFTKKLFVWNSQISKKCNQK